MARSQDAAGYVPCFDQHWAKGREIRDGDPGGNKSLAQLALNDNTNWAQRSPTVISQYCADDTYRYTFSTGTTMTDPLFAWRIAVGDESRDDMRFAVRMKSSNVANTATCRIDTVNGAASVNLDSTSLTYEVVEGIVQFADVNDHEVFYARLDNSQVGESCYIDAINAWCEPHAGDLPIGPESSGFCAHDSTEVDADSPLHVQIARRAGTNIEAAIDGKGFRYPFMGHCVRLDLTSRQTNLWTASDEWEAVGPPILWPRQFQKTTLRYNLFGMHAVNPATAEVRIRNLNTEDASEHTLNSTAAGAPDVLAIVSANWATGTMAVRPLPENYSQQALHWDTIQIEVKSDGANDAYLYGICIQEEPD